MKLKFCAPCIFVEDIARARRFYVDLLGLEVSMDHGAHVSLAEQRLSLWQRRSAEEVIFGNVAESAAAVRPRFELYFEAEDIEAANARMQAAGVSFINTLAKMPWEQYAMRVLDPDGNIVEIAEPMPAVIRRLHAEGKSVAEIASLFDMPPEVVTTLL